MKKNKSVLEVARTVETFGGNHKKLTLELKRLIQCGKRSGDFLMVGAAYCCLAEAYNEADDLHGTIVNALKAVTILKDTDEYDLIARSYCTLGHAYTYQGNNQMALACDELAYHIVKRHRIKGKTRIATLNNLSVSYRVMEETRKSIKFMNECIDLLKKDCSEEYTELVMYSLNLAEFYKDVGELRRAEEIFDSITEMLQKVDFAPIVCDYYLRRAIVSYLLKDTAAGNGYMDTAFSLFPNNVYPIPLYDDLCEVARIITKAKDRERSEKILDIMTVYAQKNKGTMEQLFATRMMANYYKDFGEYKLASEHFSKYEELNEKQLRESKEMQMKLHYMTRNTEAEVRRLKRKMRQNEELASLESLTKLLNRSALLQVSSEFIETAAKKKQKVGAIFVDIDYFKEYNDTYGHASGDEIITRVARICRKQETSNVRFARYGGDEFFGITRGLTDDEVSDIARCVSKAVRLADIPHVKNPNGGRITLSVGVVNVAITDQTNNILQIANYADKAMYYSKNTGKNAIYRLDGANKTGAPFTKIDF